MTPATQVRRPSLPPAPAHPPHMSNVRFADYAAKGLNATLAHSIPFEYCTPIQAATLDAILTGEDVYVKAKTDTGKTLAFIIPTIQRILGQNATGKDVLSLILSPTRELAQQIASEAEMVLTGAGLKDKIGVQTFVGGLEIKKDLRRIKNERLDLVIATPGRLIDLIENHRFRERLQTVSTLVLDEGDRLLDTGFKQALHQIWDSLPPRTQVARQTLFFSATFPPDFQKIAQLFLLPTQQNISTISESERATHEHVPQSCQTVPMDQLYPATAALLSRWLKEDQNCEVILFANTAVGAGVFGDMAATLTALQPQLGTSVFTTHSRLSQSRRTRAIEDFKKSKSGVLVSSDVTARGIDIPDVTHVLQVGIPSSVEQYVHRLGRTARAGKAGSGTRLLSDFERPFLKWKGVPELNIQPLSPSHLGSFLPPYLYSSCTGLALCKKLHGG
ncbi:hypothetical protein M422DRAFT_185519 [Sphaerobolus stellatus SS14]|uniref:ATP-dependent RNA helicase n=1 Tax=Sphaerobolus stellatus (strain SS14) TaxID=990650 RepID=A0A0C9UB11_SPHS4|nr:hypothetical protein M422DRAFT_185519 [Sphaerobolus stellatus SS14]